MDANNQFQLNCKYLIYLLNRKNDLIQLGKEIDNLNKVNDEREIKFTECKKERIEWNKKITEFMKEIDNV